MNKCPICDSSRITEIDDEIKCQNPKCGYLHSNKKKAQFITYEEIKIQ